MRKRVFWLGVILLVRLVWSGVVSNRCEIGDKVRLKGEVREVVQKGSKSVIKVGEFRSEFEEYKVAEKGDKVVVSGICSRGVIDFLLGRIWLKDAVISEVVQGQQEVIGVGKYLFLFKEKILDIYKAQLPAEEAGLVAGIVLGEKDLLGSRLYGRLKETGTVHIVVASGYNLMILSVILVRFLTYYVKRKQAVALALGVSFLYAVMTGWQPPVVRAMIMVSGLLIGRSVGRLVKGWWWWFLAGWGMLMVKPELAVSLSFQLSMAAVGGLITIEPVLVEWVERNLKGGMGKLILKSELMTTISAQLAVAPLLWWYFRQVQWQGVIYNSIILPLVPMLMGLGGLQAILGLVWRPWGQLVGWAGYTVAYFIVWVVG